MNDTKQFREAWLKVERAKKHIDDLNTLLAEYSATKPYEILTERDRKRRRIIYKALIKKPIPEDVTLIASDAIHNCRTALDYLACDLAIRAGASSTSGVYFPFAASGNDFSNDPRIKTKIRKLSDIDKSRIHSLTPYKGGNDLLWALHDLDRTDKHVRLMLVGTSPGGMTVSPAPGKHMDITIGYFSPHYTEANEEIYLFSINENANFYGKFNPSIDICFAEPDPIKGKPMGTTLQYFLNTVSAILIDFEI